MKYAYFILHALCLISPCTSALNINPTNKNDFIVQEILKLDGILPGVIHQLVSEYISTYENLSLSHWRWLCEKVTSLKTTHLTIAQTLLLACFLSSYDCDFPLSCREGTIAHRILQSLSQEVQTFISERQNLLLPRHSCKYPSKTCPHHLTAFTKSDDFPLYTETLPRPLGINNNGDMLLLRRGLISRFILSVRTDHTEILLQTLKKSSHLIGASWCYAHGQQADPIDYIAIIYFDPVISRRDTSYNIKCSLFNASYQRIRSGTLRNLADPNIVHNIGFLTQALNTGRIQSAHYDPQKDLLNLDSLGFIENVPLMFQAQFLEGGGLNIAFPFVLPSDKKEALVPRNISPSALVSRHRFPEGFIWLTRSGTLMYSYDTAEDHLPQEAIPLSNGWPIFWSKTPRFLLTATYNPRMSTVTWCRKRIQYLPPTQTFSQHQRRDQSPTITQANSCCITL